ncbi:hypothetical protein KM043_013133 [Ampulex compressa]|nr:hypothetical protein KM043_013133 [Ampulex compressa]
MRKRFGDERLDRGQKAAPLLGGKHLIPKMEASTMTVGRALPDGETWHGGEIGGSVKNDGYTSIRGARGIERRSRLFVRRKQKPRNRAPSLPGPAPQIDTGSGANWKLFRAITPGKKSRAKGGRLRGNARVDSTTTKLSKFIVSGIRRLDSEPNGWDRA